MTEIIAPYCIHWHGQVLCTPVHSLLCLALSIHAGWEQKKRHNGQAMTWCDEAGCGFGTWLRPDSGGLSLFRNAEIYVSESESTACIWYELPVEFVLRKRKYKRWEAVSAENTKAIGFLLFNIFLLAPGLRKKCLLCCFSNMFVFTPGIYILVNIGTNGVDSHQMNLKGHRALIGILRLTFIHFTN